MIVTTAQLYKDYADFIAHKSEKPGSKGQLDVAWASVKRVALDAASEMKITSETLVLLCSQLK
ncbi:MAG TPA: hypothetical protein VGI41_01885 [Candidatus Udaeobacter sp.]|jgi:hypothetical protein